MSHGESRALARAYTVAWILWVILLAGLEFLAPASWRVWAMPALLVVFGLLEGLAIARPKEGDTLSEHVWAFYHGKPVRAFLILGVVGFFGIRLLEFGTSTPLTLSDLAELELGRVLLVGGIVGWLIPHFLFEGKWG